MSCQKSDEGRTRGAKVELFSVLVLYFQGLQKLFAPKLLALETLWRTDTMIKRLRRQICVERKMFTAEGADFSFCIEKIAVNTQLN